MSSIKEIGTDVYVITTENWRLNSGVIVGAQRALVVDTGAGPRQGRRILDAVREITSLPLVVLNTHAHFDHYMGNAVFQRAGVIDFWAHRLAVEAIEKYGDYQRSYVGVLEPEMGESRGLDTKIIVPTRLLPGTGQRPALSRIDLGQRHVSVFSLGPGHTDNDVLAAVDDLVFAGDFVEQGADPSFEDSFPRQWVQGLQQLADLDRYRVIVPGHGQPMTREEVRTMAQTMDAAISCLAQAAQKTMPVDQDGPVTASMFSLPYGAGASRILLDRLTHLEVEGAQLAAPDAQPAH